MNYTSNRDISVSANPEKRFSGCCGQSFFSKITNLKLNSVANLKNGVIMVEMQWKSFSEIDPKRDYLAFSEIGERNSVWSYFSILMRARKVGKQLKTAKGLIEFTARLDFLSKKMAMAAVFEDEKTHGICACWTTRSMYGTI